MEDFEGSLKVVRQTLGEKLGFRKRGYWFVLHDNVLSWHAKRGDPALDFFLLQDTREIASDGQTGIILHADRGQALLLAASSLDDREKWLSALRKHRDACKGLQASAAQPAAATAATAAPASPVTRNPGISIGGSRPSLGAAQQPQKPAGAVEQFLASVRESPWESPSEGEQDAPDDDESFLVQLPAQPTKPPPRPVVEASVADDVPEPPPQVEQQSVAVAVDSNAIVAEAVAAIPEPLQPTPQESAPVATDTPVAQLGMSAMLQSVTFSSLTESAMSSALSTTESVISPTAQPVALSPPEKQPEPEPQPQTSEPLPITTATTTASEQPPASPPPLVPIDKDDYAVISLPINLELVLKSWPSQARGIVAGGIVIDRSPEGVWALNPRGRLRYAMTRDEELRKIDEEKRAAAEREDYTLAAHLLERKKELEAHPESPMASFKLSEYITLCYRDKEWVLLRTAITRRSRPMQQDGDDSWTLAALPGAISRVFASASTTLPQAFNVATTRLQELPQRIEGLLEKTPFAPEKRTIEPAAPTTSAEAATSTPSPTTEMQQAVLLAHVDKAVSQILDHFGTAPNAEERRKLGASREIAVLVRGVLCTALAELLLDGFKSERIVPLLAPFHLWDWIDGFASRHAAAAADIAAHSLRKCIANMNSMHEQDKNLRFRGFVCYALNAKLLASWMSMLAVDASHLGRFFADTSAIRAPAVVNALLATLNKLTEEHFLLSLNFEGHNLPPPQQRSKQITSSPLAIVAPTTH